MVLPYSEYIYSFTSVFISLYILVTCSYTKLIDRYRRPASRHNVHSVYFFSFLISQISQSLSNQHFTSICWLNFNSNLVFFLRFNYF